MLSRLHPCPVRDFHDPLHDALIIGLRTDEIRHRNGVGVGIFIWHREPPLRGQSPRRVGTRPLASPRKPHSLRCDDCRPRPCTAACKARTSRQHGNGDPNGQAFPRLPWQHLTYVPRQNSTTARAWISAHSRVEEGSPLSTAAPGIFWPPPLAFSSTYLSRVAAVFGKWRASNHAKNSSGRIVTIWRALPRASQVFITSRALACHTSYSRGISSWSCASCHRRSKSARSYHGSTAV